MINAMRGRFILMNRHHRFAHIVCRHNVNSIVRAQRKHGHTRQEIYRLHHVELRSLGAPAVTQHDGRSKNRFLHVGLVNTNRPATKFDAVNDNIVMLSTDLFRIGA